MGSDKQKPILSQPSEEVTKEDIKLQFHWYLFTFFIIYIGSFLIPVIIIVLLVLLMTYLLFISSAL